MRNDAADFVPTPKIIACDHRETTQRQIPLGSDNENNGERIRADYSLSWRVRVLCLGRRGPRPRLATRASQERSPGAPVWREWGTRVFSVVVEKRPVVLGRADVFGVLRLRAALRMTAVRDWGQLIFVVIWGRG
jgi:hypothetical protein